MMGEREPKRIQRSRKRDWKMPDEAVYVGRPTRWGNPFQVERVGRDLAVRLFRESMEGFFDPGLLAHLSDSEFADIHAAKERWRKRLNYGLEVRYGCVHELRGRDLACWCPLTLPDGSQCPCHADILIEIANA